MQSNLSATATIHLALRQIGRVRLLEMRAGGADKVQISLRPAGPHNLTLRYPWVQTLN